MNYKKPSFFIKNNFQKSKQTKIYFRDILNDSILKDICYKITGKTEFDVQYVDNSYQENGLEQGYNKGRLIILLFDGYSTIINHPIKNFIIIFYMTAVMLQQNINYCFIG